MSRRRPCSTWKCGVRTVPAEELHQVLAAGDRAGGPEAGGGALDECLVDLRWQGVGRQRGGAQRGRPLGTHHALGCQAPAQVVPGDLRGQGVEDRLAAAGELGVRADELVAAAVGAADRPEARVVAPVLLHPPQPSDEADQPAHVLALVSGVHHLRLATALAEPALVERDHAVPRTEPAVEGGRVGGARAAPAVAVHDHRHLARAGGSGRLEDGVADVDPGGLARIGHRREATVGHPDLAGRGVGGSGPGDARRHRDGADGQRERAGGQGKAGQGKAGQHRSSSVVDSGD